jgi:hypothetical protein
VGEIDFQVISAAENSNKFQKTRFWKEKSVENVITLAGFIFYIAGRRPYVIVFFPFRKIKIILEYFKRFVIFLHSKKIFQKKGKI